MTSGICSDTMALALRILMVAAAFAFVAPAMRVDSFDQDAAKLSWKWDAEEDPVNVYTAASGAA